MSNRKVGVVFPGFGSQYVGMVKDVYDDSRAVQEYFEEAYNCLGINFVKLCFASSDEDLNQIGQGHLSVLLADISLYTLLSELGIQPDVVAGYGVGHYAAVFTAGGFSFPDALYLLNKYCGFYQEFLGQHNLRIVAVQGISGRKLQAMCAQISTELVVTISNSATDHIVSGLAKDVKKLEQQLNKLKLNGDEGIVWRDVSLGLGINSEISQPVVDSLRPYLEKVDFKNLQLPLLSGMNGKLLTSGKMVKKDLLDQIVQPLVWQKVVQKLQDCDIIIEVGPGQRLAQNLIQVYPDKTILNLGKKSDQEQIKTVFGLNMQDISHEE